MVPAALALRMVAGSSGRPGRTRKPATNSRCVTLMVTRTSRAVSVVPHGLIGYINELEDVVRRVEIVSTNSRLNDHHHDLAEPQSSASLVQLGDLRTLRS